MSDYNNIITDKEIHDLFKQRLLEQDVDDALNLKLIDMETKFAFSSDLLMMPDLQKEKELLLKLGKKTGFGSWGKWLYTGLSCGIITLSVFLYTHRSKTVDKSNPTTIFKTPTIGKVLPAEPPKETPAVKNVSTPKSKDQEPPSEQKPIAFVSDSLSDIEAPPQNKPERKSEPILYFASGFGFNKSFSRAVNDSNRISVDTFFKGIKRVEIDGSFCDITVSTHAEDQVTMKGDMKFEFKGLVFRKPEYKLHYTRKDSVLSVWVENTQKTAMVVVGSWKCEGHLNFQMPKQTALSIKNASGNLSVSGLEGPPCYLGSSYGDIKAEHMKNKLSLNSSSGAISLNQVIGEVTCKASYGNVNFTEITGDLKISSSSGNVKLSGLNGSATISCNYGNIDLLKVNGNVTANSSSGHVKADQIQANRMSINSSYGNINISNASSALLIKSSSGNITLSNITGSISAHASYGEMHISDITGDLVLGSSSGDIEISKLVGGMVIASNYGDVTASDCIGQVNIKSSSGNINGKNILLVKDLYLHANYGDIKMNLKNDINELSFDLASGYGNLKLNKNGIKIEGKEGKLFLKKGDILVKSISSSGNQTFD